MMGLVMGKVACSGQKNMATHVIGIIRELAPRYYPPSKRGPEGDERFNVQAFLRAVHGRKMLNKTWKRLVDNPGSIKFDDAARIANALKISLADLALLCQLRATGVDQKVNMKELHQETAPGANVRQPCAVIQLPLTGNEPRQVELPGRRGKVIRLFPAM
jgi:hypothetical protein